MRKLVGLVLVACAVAAVGSPPAIAHDPSSSRQIKKLTKKVKRLSAKVKSLEANLADLNRQPGPTGATGATGAPGPATGPAGGALAGTYPDPVLAAGAVTSAAIAEGAVGGAAVLDDSLTAADLSGGATTGPITLNAGFVATGRCRDFSVAVPGARVGDVVIFSLNGAVLDDIVLSGVRVSSPDIVVAKACNLSGATFPQLNDVPITAVTISP